MRYTPTHAVQQEPMKSAREGNCFRLVSDGLVHRSRTITRTISGHPAIIFHASPTASGTGARFVRLLATSRTLEVTVYHGPKRVFVVNLVLTDPTAIAGWAFTLHPCNLAPSYGFLNGKIQPHPSLQIRGIMAAMIRTSIETTISPQFSRAAHSDCIPDVLLQAFGFMTVICGCPRTVRVLEGVARGN